MDYQNHWDPKGKYSYIKENKFSQQYKEQEKVTFIYYIVESLEKIADEFKYIFAFIKTCYK
jgi:hypothetical protein